MVCRGKLGGEIEDAGIETLAGGIIIEIQSDTWRAWSDFATSAIRKNSEILNRIWNTLPDPNDIFGLTKRGKRAVKIKLRRVNVFSTKISGKNQTMLVRTRSRGMAVSCPKRSPPSLRHRRQPRRDECRSRRAFFLSWPSSNECGLDKTKDCFDGAIVGLTLCDSGPFLCDSPGSDDCQTTTALKTSWRDFSKTNCHSNVIPG